jgi:hypothetical protein
VSYLCLTWTTTGINLSHRTELAGTMFERLGPRQHQTKRKEIFFSPHTVTIASIILPRTSLDKQRCQSDVQAKRMPKTYNSGDSLVVTHLTTNPPVQCLSTAERTGSSVFIVLWSYVE